MKSYPHFLSFPHNFSGFILCTCEKPFFHLFLMLELKYPTNEKAKFYFLTPFYQYVDLLAGGCTG